MSMLVLFLALVLVLTHYFSEWIVRQFYGIRTELISFASGISISYIFLEMLPLLFLNIGRFQNSLFFVALFGFALFHSIEKYIYQHSSRERLVKDLKGFHSAAFFVYYFVIGIILFEFSLIGGSMALLLFLPVWFNTALGSVSFQTLDEGIRGHYILRFVLSVPVLLGVLFGFFFRIGSAAYGVLLAFVVGVMLYVLIRDYLPNEREGKLVFFVSGVAIYTILIFALRYFGVILV